MRTPPWEGMNYYELYRKIALPAEHTETTVSRRTRLRHHALQLAVRRTRGRAPAASSTALPTRSPRSRSATIRSCRPLRATGRPVIVSTGIASKADIEETLRVLREPRLPRRRFHALRLRVSGEDCRHESQGARLAGLARMPGRTFGSHARQPGGHRSRLRAARSSSRSTSRSRARMAVRTPRFRWSPMEFAALVRAVRDAWDGTRRCRYPLARASARRGTRPFAVRREGHRCGGVAWTGTRPRDPARTWLAAAQPAEGGRPRARHGTWCAASRCAGTTSSEHRRSRCRRQADCPVCSGRPRPLLELPDQPIYQHPVATDAIVPPPHSIDLRWVACKDCAHAWQPEFDAGLLEQIYRQHYYTPAPDGIAVQFRDDFLSTVEEFGLLGRRHPLLEIGASSGDVLAEVRSRTGAASACAFEPDSENASLARQRGLDVREQFFGAAAVQGLPAVDLIYPGTSSSTFSTLGIFLLASTQLPPRMRTSCSRRRVSIIMLSTAPLYPSTLST